MKGLLTLIDVTRYDDVETGRLVLTVGERQKSWQAVWLTNLHIQWRNMNHLLAGDYKLTMGMNRRWYQCPRVLVTRQVGMWIEPFAAESWQDMGVDLYLCDDLDNFGPLERNRYLQFIDMLRRYKVDMLTVMPISVIQHGNKYQKIYEDSFWD
jgi:hypothetical protein